MNSIRRISYQVLLLTLFISWTSVSMSATCTDILSNKNSKLPSGHYLISGGLRKVSIVQKNNVADYINKNGLQRTIDARMDSNTLPLATNKLRQAVTRMTLRGLNRISSHFTDYPIFRQILEFNGTEDGILRSSDIMRVGRELHNKGISSEKINQFEIQIGNTLFSGADFHKLLKEARTKGGLLKVDVDFGYKDPLSNGLSFLYQWYPRVWLAGLYGSFFTDYSQTFVAVSVSSLGVYLVASVAGSILRVTPRTAKNQYLRLFMYLPNLDATSETQNFNFIKLKRAKIAIDNIELAAQRAPSWSKILIVVEDADQAKLINDELKNRFNN